MKRRANKSRNKKEDDEYQIKADDDCQLNQQQEKEKKKGKRRTSKTSSKSFEIENSEDNSQSYSSQILQIRNGEDAARDHVRPSFIRRWDGVSSIIEITPTQMKQLSPMLQIYWGIKSKNMNTIILVEFGRQFMAFENDAIRLHQIFKKKLNKFSKFLMVYLWGKESEMVKKQLFDMKIPVLMMNQFEDPAYRQKYGLVRRQISQVLTPALHLSYQDDAPRSRLLLSIYHKESKFAVLVLDSQSNQFHVEQVNDDSYLHQIRRILNKYRPVQLLIPDKQHKEIGQIAKQICNPYINLIQLQIFDSHTEINKYLMSNPSVLFKELRQAYTEQIESEEKNSIFSKYRILNVLSMVWQYLQGLSLLQKVFFQGIFHSLHNHKYYQAHFFDSQVYENLQIFRISSSEQQTYSAEGTLIGYLDRCRTQQGRKLLHKWIDQPLTQLQGIVERQQAVSELSQHTILLMHERFDAYNKLERRLGDIYHWVSRKSQRGKLILTRYINYEKQYDPRKNPAIIKLKQIIQILKLICSYEQLLKQFGKTQITSKFLKKNIQLAEIDDIHKYSVEQINKLERLPQIAYVAGIILRRISYDQNTGNLQPMPGQSEVYDSQKQEIERINNSLIEELNKWKDYFKTQKIVYVSIRAKNEIQIPKMAINKSEKHSDLIFSSEVTNATRYVTHQTYQLSQQLIQHEKGMAQSYQPFLQEIIQHFCHYKFLWEVYMKSISNLDVLISLAKVAKSMPIKCLPTFIETGLNIERGVHPNLLAIKSDIVSNTIQMSGQEKVLLLTGPNMGGKSTLLKQTCSLVILAQIGSYLPAEKYSSIIYDQIFCRMGASDRIYEGKSTFYVELQETKRILQKATDRSLVVIDQLGRGTSTFDGMAISQAILDYLINTVKCITLYSTHYTQITEKFSENAKAKIMKMGYQTDNESIHFTYQLVAGTAEKSFANNVARMVGIPESILKKAEIRSQKMHQQIGFKKIMCEINKKV